MLLLLSDVIAMANYSTRDFFGTVYLADTRWLLLSREMAVNEALPCDRNLFLVGISGADMELFLSSYGKCAF